jgi:3-dehydroquinate dehydratase-2
MNKVIIINGPNLNLTGQRQTSIYGVKTFDDYLVELRSAFHNLQIDYFQSNTEGEIVSVIQNTAVKEYSGIIINAGGYTHTSVAIADAISAIKLPVIEVHISNIFSREKFRSNSLISAYCTGSISGFGLDSYRLALNYFL